MIIPPLLDITNLSTKYFILSKVYTDEDGIKYINHGLSACARTDAQCPVLRPWIRSAELRRGRGVVGWGDGAG